MSTQYGLQIKSPFDTKDIPPVIINVSQGEHREIDRAGVPGVLAIRVQTGGTLTYLERLTEAGIYHTYVFLEGTGAIAKIISNIESRGDVTLDVVHTVNHTSSDTSSDIRVRGIIRDSSQVIYQSDILPEKNTKGILGKQSADFLLLGQKARVSAIPKLSIHTYDVVCSHGLSIKNIDSISKEYLESHGYTEAEAEAELISGFLKYEN